MKTAKRKRLKRTATLITVFLLVIVFAAPAVLAADTADRQTKNFDVKIKVNENNSYEIKENVDFVFNTPGHGVYRYIPETFNGISERVDGAWCSTDEFEDYSEEGNYIIKMGSGDSKITGKHKFEYGYQITMRDDRDTSSDYFYLDLLPVDWETSIDNSKIEIQMPKAIEEKNIELYSGTYGSTTASNDVKWELDGKKILIEAHDLQKGEGLTIKVDLPEGYWVGQYDAQGSKIFFVILLIVMALAYVGLWFAFGRKQRIIETVEFHPPKGITPAEIGLIIDGTLDKKDMVSMFMYLANKGYLKIKELKKGFQFTMLKEIQPKEEKRFAIVLFNGLFGSGEVGTTVKSKELDEDFGNSYLAACEVLEDGYGDVKPPSTKRVQFIEGFFLYVFVVIAIFAVAEYCVIFEGYFFGLALALLLMMFIGGKVRKSYKNRMSGRKSGKRVVRIIYWAIYAALLIASAGMIGKAFESPMITVLFTFCMAICQVFNVYFDKYSKKTAKHLGKILGLKNFIETAELEKINQLVEEDPEYFFNILPYAYVMGLTNKWAKKFEKIDIKAPGWYEGNNMGSTWTSVYMLNTMNSMNRGVLGSISHSLPTSGPDSGSGGGGGGFSGGGGGFSGGGAGGGGGGSW